MPFIRTARGGTPVVIFLFLIGLGGLPWSAGWGLFFGVLGAGSFWFFRDPERPGPFPDHTLLSPADGRVTEVMKLKEDPFLGGPAWRVSIFLSLFDVHVNRYPISATVRDIRYSRGRFLPAFLKKAPDLNESNLVLLENGPIRVAVRQIAGTLARRIVCYCRPGDTVGQGDRLGLIRFGSGVRVHFPAEAEPKIKTGQKVRAGETVLAVLPKP